MTTPLRSPVNPAFIMTSRYLDLLELALVGGLNDDPPGDKWHPTGQYDPSLRAAGKDWPLTAPSMIGLKRMRQLREAAEACIDGGVPGDFLEAGVWRGGACILMAGVLAESIRNGVRSMPARRVFVADSFAGLPPPTEADDHDHNFAQLSVGLEEVVKNFVRYKLLSDNVIFVPGWFKDTLHTIDTKALAILRLDGDMYESTRDGLALYPKLSPGGFCIIDDYGALPSCARAVDEYRAANNITTPIIDIDGIGAYWRK